MSPTCRSVPLCELKGPLLSVWLSDPVTDLFGQSELSISKGVSHCQLSLYRALESCPQVLGLPGYSHTDRQRLGSCKSTTILYVTIAPPLSEVACERQWLAPSFRLRPAGRQEIIFPDHRGSRVATCYFQGEGR